MLSHQVLDAVAGLLKEVSVGCPDDSETDDKDAHRSCVRFLCCHDLESAALRFQAAFTVVSGPALKSGGIGARTQLLEIASVRPARPKVGSATVLSYSVSQSASVALIRARAQAGTGALG